MTNFALLSLLLGALSVSASGTQKVPSAKPAKLPSAKHAKTPTIKPVVSKPVKNRSPISKPVYNYPSTKPAYKYPSSKPAYIYPSSKPVYNYPSSKPAYIYPSSKPAYIYPSSKPVYNYPSSKPVYNYPSSQPVYTYPTKAPKAPKTSKPNCHNNPTGLSPTVVPSAPTVFPTAVPNNCTCYTIDVSVGPDPISACVYQNRWVGVYADQTFTTNLLLTNVTFPNVQSATCSSTGAVLSYDNQYPLTSNGFIYQNGTQLYNIYYDSIAKADGILDCAGLQDDVDYLASFACPANVPLV